MSPRQFFCALLTSIALFAGVSEAGDEHWSRQFKKPAGSTKMAPNTGMADGTNKPIIRRAKWHDGKLWVSGAWECGASGKDPSKALLNVYWYLWTWCPEGGWEPVAYFHSASGGIGPDGKINDFLWLPDGRMVVVGEFTRLDNPGGVRYHRVDAAAIYDPKDPTANKWKPLGTFQYDGTVSAGGSFKCVAYDAKANDLYMGGSFAGIQNERSLRKYPHSPGIHRYDLDTQSYEPVPPGIFGSKPYVYKIIVDDSTQPSTIYVAGSFHFTGGNGEDPMITASTARYSTGFASYQEGKGWTWFPQRGLLKKDGGKEAILQRAADFKYFDSATITDALVDGKDIYIVGAFSEGKGTGQTLRGIAKWDWDKQAWIDPTGKGGIGREAYSIAKADNGKIYIGGSFGGPVGKKAYDGFKNGDPAAMCASFDPKTGVWEQLGSGLKGRSQPECRMAINGNDVYFLGDFNYIGAERTGRDRADKEWESWYIARWNETIDFTKTPAKVSDKATKRSVTWTPPTKPWSEGNEHWSRRFPKPPRMIGKKKQRSGKTGMDDGTGAPQISGVLKHGDTLYFCGRWEAELNYNWFVWSHHPEQGWKRVAWQGPGGKGEGAQSPPKGMKAKDGKLYVYGSIANYAGLGVYDLTAKTWKPFEGKTEQGQAVMGNSDPKKGKPVKDIAWDTKTGDLYMVGSTGGIENPKLKSPKMISQVIRVSKDGVYHPMGRMLMAENPGKPIVIVDSIYVDETKTPSDIYVGGTFGFYGSTTSHKNFAYNIVKWDHAAQDWRPIGKGPTIFLSPLDAKTYPEGLPGLPALPELYHGFLAAGFPRVRCITMDAEGNLYVGGTLGVVSGTFPIHERMKEETFGIAKLDAKTGKFGPCTTVGGVSRDVFQMTWLDSGRTRMLLTGGFHFDNAWNPLHGAATLDIKSGALKPLGGGLLRWSLTQVISSDVSHFVVGDNYYFAGLFDHAGVNANDLLSAPIESYYVAHYNAKENLDPNRGLTVATVDPIQAPPGFSSKSFKVTLTASLKGQGTVVWFEKRRDGSFQEKAKGASFKANLRVKGSDRDMYYYVCVRMADGTQGGKLPVRIPVLPPG